MSSGRARACLCFLFSSTSLTFSISASVSDQHLFPPHYGLEPSQSTKPQCSRWSFFNSSKFSHSARSVSLSYLSSTPLSSFSQPPLAPLNSSSAHKTSFQDSISSPPMTSLSVRSSLKSTTPTPPTFQPPPPLRHCPTRARGRNVTPELLPLHLLPPQEHIRIQTMMRGGMERKRKTHIDISSRVYQVLEQSFLPPENLSPPLPLTSFFPGKHSIKKDDFLTTIIQVPPKQHIPITPFDSRTQSEAFAVSLEGLKGVC